MPSTAGGAIAASSKFPKTGFVVYATIALGALALWPTVLSLIHDWSSINDYQYGFIVAGVCIVWLVRLKGELDACAVQPQPAMALVLFGALAVWLVAYKANNTLAHQLLLPPILGMAVFAAAGRRAALIAAAPLAYFYFSVPLWELLVPYLQAATVAAAETGLGWLGVPAQIDGITVTIPDGVFQVIEGCSGKRYFVVALALAVVAAVMARLPARRFAILVGSAAAMALLANWMRVTIVIYAGHVSHMQHYLVAVEHRNLGRVIFAILLIFIAIIARRLQDASPVPDKIYMPPALQQRPRLGALVLPWVLFAIPLGFSIAGAARPAQAYALGTLPLLADHWQGPLPPHLGWQPRFVGPQAETRAAYGSGPQTVEVYVNVYGRQGRAHELVYYLNSVLPEGWRASRQQGPDASPSALTVARGRAPAQLGAVSPSGERWTIAYIYRVGGHTTGNPLLAQLLYGAMALTREAPSGVLAFAASCGADCDAAHKSVMNLWEERGADLLALIPAR